MFETLKSYDIEKLRMDPVRRARVKISDLEKKLDCVNDSEKLA
jgi:hypothetical protein